MRRSIAILGVGLAATLGFNVHNAAANSGRLPEVVKETARSGWPHIATPAEREQAVWHVLRWATVHPRTSTGRVLCRWPNAMMGGFRCGVVVERPRGKTARYSVRVRVWEDGSYRITRPR